MIRYLRSVHLIVKICKLSVIDDGFWDECLDPDSCAYRGVYADLQEFVGKEPAGLLTSSCKCEADQYGPHCKSQPQKEDLGLCGMGTYNKANYLTACDCRNSTGHVVPYHGWYCEVHNKLLCSKLNPFYDASAMDDTVGDNSNQKACKKCEKFIENCAECVQDENTKCKSFA